MSLIEILYIDQYIVVINKAPGLLSVPFPGFKGKTAQSVLEDILRKQGRANSKHHPFAVHRLDRDTSGVMMFALTAQAQKVIMDNWHKMVTGRIYHALTEVPCHPENFLQLPDNTEGWINDDLAMNAHHIGYVPDKKSPGFSDGKRKSVQTISARTHYKILKRSRNFCLFELELDTGRKNQIRAHLGAYGYPVCGDKDHRSHSNPFDRLCLHAVTLEFVHPFTKEKMKFEIPEPSSWKEKIK